ncbi:amidinotransferase [bacterium SCSIO 12643]|nr:amidinotransferase [bacterium SCSIO 12643]
MNPYFTSSIFMVRPASFGMNPETSGTNAFQSTILMDKVDVIQQKAESEFDAMVDRIRKHGVNVKVFQDTKDQVRPDAVFPNNWISTHPNGPTIIYPMLAPNRRLEVREDVVDYVMTSEKVDLTSFAEKEVFLEGTGCMVIDHQKGIIYVARSQRVDDELVKQVAEKLNFSICSFLATDHQNNPIYHTNVAMFVTHSHVGIALETIKDEKERFEVVRAIESSGKKVLELSYYQITQFSGNMIQLQDADGQLVLVASCSGWNALDEHQKEELEKESKIVAVDIPTIEMYGGGSARCMIAEVFRA